MRTLLEIAGRRPVPERAEDAIQFAPTAPVAERNGAGNGNGNGAAPRHQRRPPQPADARGLAPGAGARR